MRIAFFSEAFEPQVNGVVITLAKVTEYLRCRGHEIVFVVPRNRQTPRHDNVIGLKCVPFPLYPEMPIILPHWSFHRKEFARLEEFQPDLVHVWTPGVMGFFGQKWARSHGCPVVVSYETDIVAYLRYYGFGRFVPQLWKYLKWLHNNCQRTYVPSRDTKRFLDDNGIHDVRVFERGVDTTRFHPSKRNALVRKQFGIGPDGVLLLYVGRLSQEKNLPLLLQSAARLTGANPKVRLVVTGTGPLERKLQRSFQQAGIIFTGVRRGEDLSTLFASADAFALPSSTETLSLVGLEAMASGIPVVAMNEGGVRDFLRHRENSLLADNEREFDEYLRLLADNPTLRQELGANGRRCAEARTWPAAIAALVQDYENIICVAGRRTA